MKRVDEDQVSAAAILQDDQFETVRIAIREGYGLDVSTLNQLGGELDLNFRAQLSDGQIRFLRLTPAPLDIASVEWQNTVLRQLEQRPLSVAYPHLLRQKNGAVSSMLKFANGKEFLLRMTTWVTGRNVAEFGTTTRAYRLQLGNLAAEVIESLSDLNTLGDTHNSHHWMVVRSGDSLRETMDAAVHPGQRELLNRALSRFDAVQHRIHGLPKSVVHQDLHDFNLLAREGTAGETKITGVVDFNDAIYTARVAEVAVAAAYSSLRQQDPFLAFSEVVEGYLSRADLSDLEVDLLYPLAVARLAVNASTWTHRSHGENASYAVSRMAATWPALEALLEITPDAAAARFRELGAPQIHTSSK